MKKLFLLFGLWGFLYPQFESSVTIEKPDKIVALFTERFNTYQTYQADFKEINNKSLKFGKIYFKKPSLIRIKYFQKDQVVTDIFADDNELFIHFVKNKIIFQQELPKQEAEIPGKGLDAYYLIKNYNFNFKQDQNMVEIFSNEEKKRFLILAEGFENLAYHLILSPKDIENGLNKLELWISKIGDIVRLKSININGGIVDFYFFNQKINEEIVEENFNFVIPASARIVKNILQN